jgi:hypothetical protein
VNTLPLFAGNQVVSSHVTRRAKMDRPEVVEKAKQSEHWQHQAKVLNQPAEWAEIWE